MSKPPREWVNGATAERLFIIRCHTRGIFRRPSESSSAAGSGLMRIAKSPALITQFQVEESESPVFLINLKRWDWWRWKRYYFRLRYPVSIKIFHGRTYRTLNFSERYLGQWKKISDWKCIETLLLINLHKKWLHWATNLIL